MVYPIKKKKKDMVGAILEAQEKGRKYWTHPTRKIKKSKDTVTVDGKEFTMKDLKDFFIQTRGFPTILRLGDVYGEGQSGGRYVTEMAHKVENAFVEKYGEEEYKKKMGKLMEGK